MNPTFSGNKPVGTGVIFSKKYSIFGFAFFFLDIIKNNTVNMQYLKFT